MIYLFDWLWRRFLQADKHPELLLLPEPKSTDAGKIRQHSSSWKPNSRPLRAYLQIYKDDGKIRRLYLRVGDEQIIFDPDQQQTYELVDDDGREIVVFELPHDQTWVEV